MRSNKYLVKSQPDFKDVIWKELNTLSDKKLRDLYNLGEDFIRFKSEIPLTIEAFSSFKEPMYKKHQILIKIISKIVFNRFLSNETFSV